MKISPKKDPNYIYRHPYATLVADDYRMKRDYRIVRPNGTDDHLLFLTHKGGGLFNSLKLAPGSVLLVKPNTPQDYGTDPAAGSWDFSWMHFHAPVDWNPFMYFDEKIQGASLFQSEDLPPIEHRRVKALITDAVARTKRGTALDRAFAMNALENVILRLSSATNSTDARDDSFIDTANKFIRDHLSEKLAMSDIADGCGLSVSRFAHKFTEVFGVSPQAYVEKLRLEYAKRLLETSVTSVKEVAFASGFPDSLYFSRRFRRAYGLSPSGMKSLPAPHLK